MVARFLFKPYSLELKEPFGTAHGTRTHTDGMIVALEIDDGLVGYGEAFMPPYYNENQTSMSAFFEKIDPVALLIPFSLDNALDYVNALDTGNTAAKAAVDIALHDLFGKGVGECVRESVSAGVRDAGKWDAGMRGKSVAEAIDSEFGITSERGTRNSELSSQNRYATSFTIGIDTVETMVRKAKVATDFKILKIKLNGKNDIEVIGAIRDVTDQLLFVDANQAWDDLETAIEIAEKLVGLGVELIEQPFRTGEISKSRILMESCAVPVVADEEVQGIEDIERLAGSFDGINIKLMKCGGIREGFRMITEARRLGLKVLIGCMTESSIGISAAAQLAQFADWCDLDGNLLIKNDTCTAVKTIDGELRLTDAPGIGITDDTRLREFF